MTPVAVARWSDLEDRAPAGALVVGATVRGDDFVSGLHGWDWRRSS